MASIAVGQLCLPGQCPESEVGLPIPGFAPSAGREEGLAMESSGRGHGQGLVHVVWEGTPAGAPAVSGSCVSWSVWSRRRDVTVAVALEGHFR